MVTRFARPGPGLVLLAAGVALGPHGLNILSDAVLGPLNPAVSVALAALGALVGLSIRVHPREARGRLATASFEAAVTIAVTTLGLIALHTFSNAGDATPWLLALTLAVCASASASSSPAADVLPIIVGAIVLAALTDSSDPAPARALRVTAEVGAMAVAVAAAAWLLRDRHADEGDERVFSAGALLLLGGVAAHLSQSALFTGLVAGVFWNATSPEPVVKTIRQVQGPLLVLLLLVAGARLELARELAIVVAAYLCCRIAGMFTAHWLGRALSRQDHPSAAAALSPGITGVAFALGVLVDANVGGAEAVLTVVVAGSLFSEALALMVAPQGTQA